MKLKVMFINYIVRYKCLFFYINVVLIWLIVCNFIIIENRYFVDIYGGFFMKFIEINFINYSLIKIKFLSEWFFLRFSDLFFNVMGFN